MTGEAETAVAPGSGAASPPMPACPYCGGDLRAYSETCPLCYGNVRPLLRTWELPDQYFNDALKAARRRKWGLAAEHLAVTLALRPDDVEALVLLGKVRFRQGERQQAVDTWRLALSVDGTRDDLRRTIERVAGPGAPQPARRRPAKKRHKRRR